VISIALILVVAVVYTSLFVQKSLFVSEGIQQKMAFEIPALLNLRRPADSSAKTLGELSREIVQGHSITRDLVITGSMGYAEGKRDTVFVYAGFRRRLHRPRDEVGKGRHFAYSRPVLQAPTASSGFGLNWSCTEGRR
jgi:hypothetical protein